MQKREIQIAIQGALGAGKTTFAKLIRDYLRSLPSVEVCVEDGPHGNMEDFYAWPRVSAPLEPVQVKIQVLNADSAHPDYHPVAPTPFDFIAAGALVHGALPKADQRQREAIKRVFDWATWRVDQDDSRKLEVAEARIEQLQTSFTEAQQEIAALKAAAKRPTEEREAHLVDLLSRVYDLWDDGADCYEDAPEGDGDDGAYLGHAVDLSDELDDEILAVIPPEKSGPPGEQPPSRLELLDTIQELLLAGAHNGDCDNVGSNGARLDRKCLTHVRIFDQRRVAARDTLRRAGRRDTGDT